ncbi:zinc finger protein 628-like isoform X1 [Leguminivora glycinivorella]|uniref:zinc finger protein 628-like isoform X1 n=1 Tax=Leguminivora glycinivorella TaxID=1035111 RepID=UPI00200DA051|nr:zinc finger protein 628-like isoform X1 [Leguminivora glycinivorella]
MSTGTEQIFLPDSARNLPHGAEMMRSTRPGNGAPTINTTNLENVSDFSKVCRVCATVTELVIPIYGEEGLRNNLADKIKRHLPIKVTENDVLPLVVCFQCSSTLLATHELVACSLQADAALRTVHAQRVKRERRAQPPPPPPPPVEPELDTEGIVEDRPDNYRRCEFCPLVVLSTLYVSHLVGRHADLLFHCDECNSYVARRQFVAHMTFHAHQYDAIGRPPVPKPFSAPPYPLPAPAPSRPDTTTAPADSTTPAVATPAPAPAAAERHRHRAAPEPEAEAQPVAVAESNPNPVEIIESDSVSDDSDDPVENPVPAQVIRPESNAQVEATEPESEKKPAVRQCPHCPKTYKAPSSYFYHLKYTHGKSREHECGTCGRRFGTRGALRQHASLHEPAPAAAPGLQCDQCGKRFRTKAGHYIHAQTHKGDKEKKYACAECGRAFRWRTELKRHVARHEAKRTHACEACGRAFSVRADLLRHARTHQRAPHVCPAAGCGLTFAQARYLRAHEARKHGDDAPGKAQAPRKSA